jgi:hypothetical protein
VSNGLLILALSVLGANRLKDTYFGQYSRINEVFYLLVTKSQLDKVSIFFMMHYFFGAAQKYFQVRKTGK